MEINYKCSEFTSILVMVLHEYPDQDTTVKLGLRDHPTVPAKAVVMARWSLKPGSAVSAQNCRCMEKRQVAAKPRGRLHQVLLYRC